MDDNDSTLKFEHPKWKSSLVENLTVLFKKGELCDLYIMCQDHRDADVSFACHACILASASPVIRKLLMKNDIFAAWTKLAIKSFGISSTEWQYILKYVYTGTVNIQEPHIYSVWKAALYLQIDILVTVLATCVHKYHYPAKDMDRLPHLKVCPFDTNCVKNSRYLQSVDIICDNQNNSDLVKPLYYDTGGLFSSSVTMKQNSDWDDGLSRNQDYKRFNSEPTHCDNVIKQNVNRLVQSDIIDSKTCNMSDEPINKKTSTERSTLIKTLLMKDNFTSNDFVQSCSGKSNSEPSATKKRKMYKPRRVQAHEKHIKPSNYNLMNLYSSSEDTDAQHRLPASQYNNRNRSLTSDSSIMSNQRYITISPDTEYSQTINRSQSSKCSTVESVISRKPLIIEPCDIGDDTKPLPIDTSNYSQSPHMRDVKCTYQIYDDSRHTDDSFLKSEIKTRKSVLYGLLHEPKEGSEGQEESSVLKTLLVSNCNTYRSPEKPGHAVMTPKKEPNDEDMIQQMRASSSEDGEEDEYYKFDLGYKPIGKTPPALLKPSMKRKYINDITKCTSKEKPMQSSDSKSSPNRVFQQSKGKNEPYSASSILLSMIKDAGVRKSNPSPDPAQYGIASLPQKLCSESHQKSVVHEDTSVTDTQFKESDSGSFMSTPKGILRNLLKEKGVCEDNKSCDSSSQNKVSVADDTGLNLQVSSDSNLVNQPEVPPVVSLPTHKKLLAHTLPFSNVLQNLALAYNCATKATHESSLLKHMLDDKPREVQISENKKCPSFENQLSESIDMNNISTYDEKYDHSEIPRNPDSTSASLKITISKTGSDFEVKQEMNSQTNDQSNRSPSFDDLYGRYVLNVPRMGNTSNTVYNDNNKLKDETRNESAEKIQIMDVLSLKHTEFEQTKRSKEFWPSTKDSILDKEKAKNDNVVLNLSVKNENTDNDIVEKVVESSLEGSDGSDVEVAQFSGLQSADSAVSVSDTEVADD